MWTRAGWGRVQALNEGLCDLPNLEVLELGYNLIKKVTASLGETRLPWRSWPLLKLKLRCCSGMS